MVLYTFTYFLPTPDNANKAKSTYYFRILLLFVIAAQSAVLFRYEHAAILSIVLTNLFILAIAYSLMCAIYSRYDANISQRHYLLMVVHSGIFLSCLYYFHQLFGPGYWRSVFVFINICIPYGLTIHQCHLQFKKDRVSDRVLYSALLITIMLCLIYIFFYSTFFRDQAFVPITLTFIILLSFVCVLFFGFALSIIYSLVDKLRVELVTDRLTGAKNRNYLGEISQQLISMAKRTNTPLSLIICDIDRFKVINDTHGHGAGDKVLIEFAKNIKNTLRAEDIFIRVGGEEFVILLPQINVENALLTANRLRLSTEKLPIVFGDENLTITASFGIASVDLNHPIEHSVNKADEALYQAKGSGRNRAIAVNH